MSPPNRVSSLPEGSKKFWEKPGVEMSRKNETNKALMVKLIVKK
jgi:hypothetical protein